MKEKPIIIKQPYFIMFKDEQGKAVCRIHQDDDSNYQEYGLLICDLVRHVARAFNVDEESVWEWIEKERDRPTTTIEGGMVS